MNRPDTQAPVALITGAARRIGAAIAEYLQQNGYQIIVHCYQSKKDAQSLVDKMNHSRPASARLLVADLTDKAAVFSLVQETISWAGKLHLLVNNASIFKPSDLNPMNDLYWDELFVTNVRAPYWLSLAAYPYLVKTNGVIVNITDIHADKPLTGYAEYCQTKAALTMQTKALAREFAPHVRVNAVAPGAIAWPEDENELDKATQEKIIKNTPLHTHGHPDYIAKAVFALAENPFITGQTLRVDGGRSVV